MAPEVGYADSVDRLWTFQREARLTDKELAKLAGISPNTVKSCRHRGELFGTRSLWRLREKLGEPFWTFICGTGDWSRLDAKAAALEAQSRLLEQERQQARRPTA